MFTEALLIYSDTMLYTCNISYCKSTIAQLIKKTDNVNGAGWDRLRKKRNYKMGTLNVSKVNDLGPVCSFRSSVGK